MVHETSVGGNEEMRIDSSGDAGITDPVKTLRKVRREVAIIIASGFLLLLFTLFLTDEIQSRGAGPFERG